MYELSGVRVVLNCTPYLLTLRSIFSYFKQKFICEKISHTPFTCHMLCRVHTRFRNSWIINNISLYICKSTLLVNDYCFDARAFEFYIWIPKQQKSGQIVRKTCVVIFDLLVYMFVALPPFFPSLHFVISIYVRIKVCQCVCVQEQKIVNIMYGINFPRVRKALRSMMPLLLLHQSELSFVALSISSCLQSTILKVTALNSLLIMTAKKNVTEWDCAAISETIWHEFKKISWIECPLDETGTRYLHFDIKYGNLKKFLKWFQYLIPLILNFSTRQCRRVHLINFFIWFFFILLLINSFVHLIRLPISVCVWN